MEKILLQIKFSDDDKTTISVNCENNHDFISIVSGLGEFLAEKREFLDALISYAGYRTEGLLEGTGRDPEDCIGEDRIIIPITPTKTRS